ncbi:MAG: translation initiation factor eIF-1A [Nitrososphaerales archaeon]
MPNSYIASQCRRIEVFNIGKRKVLSESELKELVLPQENELLGRVIKLPGGDHVIVKCTDGKVRVCRIRGKMKRRMWVRENDVVLLVPWDFQDAKADIVWRYIQAHAQWLVNNNYLPNE